MSLRVTRPIAATAAAALVGSAMLALTACGGAASATPSTNSNAAAVTSTPASATTATTGASGTTAKEGLQLSVTPAAASAGLHRGGAARTETLEIRNNTDKPQKFSGILMAYAVGPTDLHADQLAIHATALASTPATGNNVTQSPGYSGAFFPRGHDQDDFTIPAHTTFSWRITIAVTKAFPADDTAVSVSLGYLRPQDETPISKMVTYKVR